MKSLACPTLAAALALAACHAPQTTDNAMVNAEDAADMNDAAFDDGAPVVEDARADAAAVAVVAVPKPVMDLPPADAAPINDAAAIEDDIRRGNGIERVRYGQGWAWMRGGKILRTADRDGRNAAYFRGDDETPFFVQHGDESWAYQAGKPVRAFDRDGRVRAPDPGKTREAVEAERAAREQRQRAEQARDRAEPARGGTDHGSQAGDRGDRGARPTPTTRPHGPPDGGARPTASATPERARGDRDAPRP